jgi:hypothetical protein
LLTFQGSFLDGTVVTIDFRPRCTTVNALGGQATLTEFCEQLAWLGSALADFPKSNGVSLSTPHVQRLTYNEVRNGTPVDIAILLGFKVTPFPKHPMQDTTSSCWHAMFRNPTIVEGFPIPAREKNEHGLHIPFEMMHTLTETHFLTSYARTAILKGFCTLLVPTCRTKHSITWHFLHNDDGKRIPHSAFRNRVTNWLGADEVKVTSLDTPNLHHYVGWSSNVTSHFGTSCLLGTVA